MMMTILFFMGDVQIDNTTTPQLLASNEKKPCQIGKFEDKAIRHEFLKRYLYSSQVRNLRSSAIMGIYWSE